MSGDEKLIRRLLNQAENDPSIWRCASGCRTVDGERCLHTMAVDLSGGVWAGKAGGDLGEWVDAEPEDNPDHVRHIIHAHDRANRIIGVDLGDRWTLKKLRSLIDR